MSDKEQLIKEEIERLYNLYELSNDYQRMGACSTILDFIDSLPEEPASEDLEKEISKWRNHYISVLENNFRIDLIDIEVTAKHFAHWQHGKDFDDLLQSDMEFPKEYYAKGKADAMQDFLKKAEEFFKSMYETMGKPKLGDKTIELFKNYMQNE